MPWGKLFQRATEQELVVFLCWILSEKDIFLSLKLFWFSIYACLPNKRYYSKNLPLPVSLDHGHQDYHCWSPCSFGSKRLLAPSFGSRGCRNLPGHCRISGRQKCPFCNILYSKWIFLHLKAVPSMETKTWLFQDILERCWEVSFRWQQEYKNIQPLGYSELLW